MFELKTNDDSEGKYKGLFFRCSANKFLTSNYGVSKKVSFHLLKRKSCLGCKYCDVIKESLSDNADVFQWPRVLRDKGLYKAMFVCDSTDPETGYCDDFHVMFVHVMEEENDKI